MGEHSLYVSHRLGLLAWEPLGLTQLGECDSYKVEVVGSNPTRSTMNTFTSFGKTVQRGL